MGLYSTIDPARRQVEQGNTWTFAVEPAITQSRIAAGQQGGSTVIYGDTLTTQWRGTVHLAKRYRYVGLLATGIDTLVDTIRGAYTVDLGKWGLGIDATQGIRKYMQVGTASTCCASVTPVHEEGPSWAIEVDVDATAEMFSASDAPPSDTAMKALLADVADFPEDGGSL